MVACASRRKPKPRSKPFWMASRFTWRPGTEPSLPSGCRLHTRQRFRDPRPRPRRGPATCTLNWPVATVSASARPWSMAEARARPSASCSGTKHGLCSRDGCHPIGPRSSRRCHTHAKSICRRGQFPGTAKPWQQEDRAARVRCPRQRHEPGRPIRSQPPVPAQASGAGPDASRGWGRSIFALAPRQSVPRRRSVRVQKVGVAPVIPKATSSIA